jgi:hypothetical protein
METQQTDNTTIAEETVGDQKWNINDPIQRDIVSDFFKSNPDFRIAKFMNRYFLQQKLPNLQEEYTDLNQCFYYENIKCEFFKNSFIFLFSARKAFKKYITKAIFFPIEK